MSKTQLTQRASKVYFIMERVETLLKKLQEQFEQKAPTGQLLLTIQMLQAELLHQEAGSNPSPVNNPVTITVTQNSFLPVFTLPVENYQDNTSEEKIIEVLQVDEAALEAELEEIKLNAEMMKKISAQNKPPIFFDIEEDIPTLSNPKKNLPVQTPREINETIAGTSSSVNERLKQSKIDLGDSLTEVPIRDLKKAIGVNDRFLFMNELFRGDEVAYERSIKTINGFSILPEAEYWIQRELKVKNGWNDSNEVVKQFYQLIKRRFS